MFEKCHLEGERTPARYWSTAVVASFLSFGSPSLAAEPSASTTTEPTATEPPAAAAAGEPAVAAEPAAPQVADQESVTKEASDRFRRGIGFYEEGDYRLALIEFERAYQLVPNYRVLFNIGQVAISLGQFARARIALERYLKEGQGEVDETRRISVERDLEMLRGRTATVELHSMPDGAEVLLNDRLIGVTPIAEPIVVDAGDHRLKVTKKKFVSGERRFTLGGGEKLEVTLTLEPERVEKQVVVVERPSTAPKPSTKDALLAAPWVAWVATGLLATGTAITWGVGAGKASELNDLRSRPDPDPLLLNNVASDAKVWLVTTDVLMVASGTALATSLFLQLYRPSKRESARSADIDVAASPFGASVQLSGRF